MPQLRPKIPTVGVGAQRGLAAAFMLEWSAAATFSSPNICDICGIHDEDEQAFIEMGYVEGRSLRIRVKHWSLEAHEG